MFVNLFNVSTPSAPFARFQDCKDLMALCDKFDCSSSIIQGVRARIKDLIPGRQWAVLIYAGERKDVELAVSVLNDMDTEHFLKNYRTYYRTTFGHRCVDVPPEDILKNTDYKDRMRMLPSSWQAILYDLCWSQEDRGFNERNDQLSISDDWGVIAENFVLGDPEG
ncbi:hypothetical protein IAR55_006204 [Kwoniella newhampshirensis]|uniref:Uncharacterized protein n=1 Tax=Kwoniella newhampshirensis TaxID=1651941 RepID=A0AAW0YUK8_9TREE